MRDARPGGNGAACGNCRGRPIAGGRTPRRGPQVSQRGPDIERVDQHPKRTDYGAAARAGDESATDGRQQPSPPASARRLTAATAYALCGFLFGLAFPLGCLAMLVATGRLDAEAGPWPMLARAHDEHVLLYVIDSAPAVLAWFARLAGLRQDSIVRFSQSLEAQVADKTRDLWMALEDARRARETVLHMAQHDALTGLPNRMLLRLRTEQAIAHAQISGQRAALAFFDLDKFKLVNDTLGHEAGDDLLREVADRLTRAVRSGDTVARLGGDEFVIVLADLSHRTDAEAVLHKLVAAVAEPMSIAGFDIRVTASVGLGIFPDDGATSDALMRVADHTMYAAKHAGDLGDRTTLSPVAAVDAAPTAVRSA